MRLSKAEYFIEIAKTVAIRSTCLKRQYGAVVVNNDEIISKGYNGSPRGETNCCDAGVCYKDKHLLPIDPLSAVHGDQYGSCLAVHAEMNAIISASRKDLNGATLYLACLDENVNPIPCNICNRRIVNAGIKNVITKKGDC